MEMIVTTPNKPQSPPRRGPARAAYDGSVPPRTAPAGQATAKKPRSVTPLIIIFLLSLAPVVAVGDAVGQDGTGCKEGEADERRCAPSAKA